MPLKVILSQCQQLKAESFLMHAKLNFLALYSERSLKLLPRLTLIVDGQLGTTGIQSESFQWDPSGFANDQKLIVSRVFSILPTPPKETTKIALILGTPRILMILMIQRVPQVLHLLKSRCDQDLIPSFEARDVHGHFPN